MNVKKIYIKVARGKIPMEKNITVTDKTGKRLGLTYLKRAKGLVKNGRAEFVSENEIIISDKSQLISLTESNFTEDNKMSEYDKKVNTSEEPEENNKIYFNAREWTLCGENSSSKGERAFVTDFEGNLSEAYCIGDKTQNVTEIGTKQLVLKKNTKYTLYFWIKIDKALKFDALCQLQIIYNNDFDNKRMYVLSNNNIRPSKAKNGWKLYEIPFITEDNEYTQLRFSVKSASFTVIPGKEAKYYPSISDEEYDSYDYDDTTEQNKTFKNIPNPFKDFFSQFDSSKSANGNTGDNTSKNTTSTLKDPFTAFNDFTKQLKKDIQREVNKSVRNDIYSDIKSMKDDIVNEIKSTFSSNKDKDNK